ncbi:hypothetical protein CGCVW01_v001238 [Colletotrichum viniferum]|nr:hypothetical protein CGCVW01_v001238 [Colletotrichum viniferum]
MLKTDLNNDNSKKRITAPDEPTAQEVGQGGSLECRGVWAGWYLPLEDLQFNRKVHKGLSVKRLCEGDGADSQIAAARAIEPTKKALRCILQLGRGFSNTKYHALAYPDADTGLCSAVQIDGGTDQIFFFRECRDVADDIGKLKERRKTWNQICRQLCGGVQN